MVVLVTIEQEASVSEASTIGLDLAKRVFQAHGADASGKVVFRKRLRRAGAYVFRWPASMRCGDGSLQQCALLGACDRRAWPYSPPDPAGLREAVCKAAEERYHRRRGDLRGGAEARCALCR